MMPISNCARCGKVFNPDNPAEKICADCAMDEAKETFMPGRLDQKQGLQKMREILQKLDEGLRAHFTREETALLAAFEKHGDRELVKGLNALLGEHADLRKRLEHAQRHIIELLEGGLAQHKWQASAHDMRTHMTHTRKLIEAHAAAELPLLKQLRRKLGD